MHEPSDGIAEEVERELQLALAAAAIAARRAIAARGQALEEARRDSDEAARAAQARIDAERLLAAERVRPVFDEAWWEAAGPREVADMWGEANSWRDPDSNSAEPTMFEQAALRIRAEVRDRGGLDPTQVVALAAVQELEEEHQAALAQPAGQQSDAAAAAQDAPRALDDQRRREQLRARLAAADVPETAIEARTLADLAQAREAVEAARTPAMAAAEPRPAASNRSPRELTRRR
jgi:hypothetical protein